MNLWCPECNRWLDTHEPGSACQDRGEWWCLRCANVVWLHEHSRYLVAEPSLGCLETRTERDERLEDEGKDVPDD